MSIFLKVKIQRRHKMDAVVKKLYKTLIFRIVFLFLTNFKMRTRDTSGLQIG